MRDATTNATTHRGRGTNPEQPFWGRWAVVGAAAIIMATVVLVGVNLTAQALALLFAAIVIAEAIEPLIVWLERRMPRGLAVIGIYLILIALVIAGLWYVVPNIANQALSFAVNFPAYADRISDAVESFGDVEIPGFGSVQTTIEQGIGQMVTAIVGFSGTLVSSVAQVLIIAFMSAYWLMSRSAFFDFLRSLAPPHEQHAMSGTIDAFSETVGGYVRGVLISGVVIGTLVYIGLTIIGVDYALVLALVAAFGELLPIIGPILAAVPAVILALFESSTQAVIVAVFYLLLQQIESNIVTPNVMSAQADVPPLLTLFAVTAGGSIGGILGAVIAVPVAGVIKVLTVQVAAPGVRRWTGATQAPTTVEEAQEEAHEEAEKPAEKQGDRV